jgi:hypothetical protein
VFSLKTAHTCVESSNNAAQLVIKRRMERVPFNIIYDVFYDKHTEMRDDDVHT